MAPMMLARYITGPNRSRRNRASSGRGTARRGSGTAGRASAALILRKDGARGLPHPAALDWRSPMAERRLHGLQRVLGVNALFSTAYGNVGSSIYYALGLVASFALGLTPVVFVIAGIIFYLTAATYAEATAMYPEAGGAGSFARRAVHEVLWVFAAWGPVLNHVLTNRHPAV